MKKIVGLSLALVMCLSLAGCKSKEVTEVEKQISALGTITLESGEALQNAEKAYDALTEEDAKKVSNSSTLADAKAAYEKLVAEKEISEKASAIEAAIAEAVANVTIESESAIQNAEKQYNAASEEVKAAVGNYAELTKAAEKISDLRVGQITDLISAIGNVTLESSDAIKEAEAAYKSLSAADKDKVTNHDVLEAAIQSVKDLKTAEANRLLSAMICEEDKIRGYKFYYPSGWPYYAGQYWAADQRSFVLPYIGMDKSGDVWLRLVYNYTGSDWIFFTKVTVATDNERYYESFKYFDIVHDNSGGKVWEYMDDDVGNYEIEMMWDMVNSGETLVRFEGDDYYRDYTIGDTDKEVIRQALTVFELLDD